MSERSQDAAALRGGRQPVTTTSHISHVAFQLFVSQGYDNTTVEQIAQAAGIGRRTLFRYFPSKNDIAWGDFDAMLAGFRMSLERFSPEVSIAEALREAIIEFNTFPPEETLYHRERMNLLMTVPSLVGYSPLRYLGWRLVIHDFVASRLGVPSDAFAPRTVAWVCLGLSLAAYEQWLAEPGSLLPDLLRESFRHLEDFVAARGVSLLGPH